MVTTTTAAPDLHDLDPDDIAGEYTRRSLGHVADVHLVEAVARILAEPRADAPDSFILHAPLELLARAALLPHVSPESRDAARLEIVRIAAQFEAFGPGEDPVEVDFVHPTDAVDALRAALSGGDLAMAGAAGRHLGSTLDVHQLGRALGDLLVPSLAAAAHGSIFLHHLPRAAPRSPLAGAMFGTLAREVARHPEWALHWHVGDLEGTDDLATALAATPVLGPPGSTFIQPLMSQAEESGLAAEIVGGAVRPETEPNRAAATITRIATASMIVDDPVHAPYGWSHCLTIPQGLLATLATTARADRVLAVAATHVVGFRAALGSAPLDQIDGPGGRIGPDGLLPGIEQPDAETLRGAVDFAASHEDAHLTKYLVSCMDAARADHAGGHQYLAAAVHLADWWRALEA